MDKNDVIREADAALVRDILEALCEREGLSLDSEVDPDKPARNYELALRLGIGQVFGLENPPPKMQDMFIDGQRFATPTGHYTGLQVRVLRHPPIERTRDVFLLLEDDEGKISELSQQLLMLDTDSVYLEENRARHFITKDRNRP